MSRLEELIQEYCPDGVEYRSLGELGEFYGGLTGKLKADFTNGNATFISYRNAYSNPSLDIHPSDRVKISEGEKQHILHYGDVIFTGSSETPDECGFSSVVTEKPVENLYLNSFCFFFRFNDTSIINPHYAKHLFRSVNLRYQIGKTASGVTRFNVSKDKMAKVIIPIPPLPVQQEIVRILDSFTQLTAELQAELQARKKQYEYYADIIVSRIAGYSWMKLDDCLQFITYGFTNPMPDTNDGPWKITAKDIKEGAVNLITARHTTQEAFDRLTLKSKPIVGDVLLTKDGTLGRSAVVSSPNICINQSVALLRVKTEMLLPEYLHCLLHSPKYKQKMMEDTGGGTIKHIYITRVNQMIIPVPSLDEQKHIVALLDRFDTLCNDLTTGLPAEIAARQKQYEYYRDKLLTFKELGA